MVGILPAFCVGICQRRTRRQDPPNPAVGGAVRIAFDLHNPTRHTQDVLVDLRVLYIKANGSSAAKVFKLKSIALSSHATLHLRKKLSLVEMTTRKHYAGCHAVELLVNGQVMPLGSFQLLPAPKTEIRS